MIGQLSIFDYMLKEEMYDGYGVNRTVTIVTCGSMTKLVEGSICYFITKSKNVVSIVFPNEYGGGYGFSVTEKQFLSFFSNLNKKVFPKSKEIWNGKSWVCNPSLI